MATQATAFGQVLGALMESRGIPAEQENMVGMAEEWGLDPQDLLARVKGETLGDIGDLNALAESLTLSEVERRILAKAYVYEEGGPGDVRAELFGNIITHLDFVAALDEQDHGGSSTARYIRAALIPFCEVEQDEARHAKR